MKTENVNQTAAPTEPSSTTGRDDKGRFTIGNLGGPGNPFARRCARMRQMMIDAATDDKLQKIIDVMFEKAMNGDIAAAKLVFSYTIGRPAAVVDPETLDQHELKKVLDGHMPSTTVLAQIINGMPLELLLKCLRIAVPEFTRNKAKVASDMIFNPTPEESELYDEVDDELDEDEMEASQEPASTPPPAQPESRTQAEPPVPGEVDPALLHRFQQRMKGSPPMNDPRRPSPNGKNGHDPRKRPSPNGKSGKAARKKSKKRKLAGVR